MTNGKWQMVNDRRPRPSQISDLRFEIWLRSALGLAMRIIDAIFDLLKDRIFTLDVCQPPFVDLVLIDHLVDSGESMDMIFKSFNSILDHGSGRDDERPIRRLRQQQFAPRLVQ